MSGDLTAAEYLALGDKARARNKYGARAVVVDGIRFDSMAEARHYAVLKLRLHAGEIADMAIHPRFDLWVGDVKVATYIADFQYREDGKLVVVDVKGGKATITPVFRLKARLMKAIHGIDVVIVGRA